VRFCYLSALFLFMFETASACSSASVSTPTDAGLNERDGAADSGTGADASERDSSVAALDAGRDAAPVLCDVEPSREPERLIGRPSWKMAELVAYAAPVGVGSDDVMDQTTNLVLGPNHGVDRSKNLTKALLPHPGPYDTEIETGLVKAGFTSKGCMKLSALAAPKGFIVSMTIVPSASAPSGKSFESSAIEPVVSFNTLDIDADLYINGALVDPDFDSEFPRASLVYSDATLAGYSHLILNFGENASFAPLTTGNYDFRVKLSDKLGNFTFNAVRFKVVD